MRFPFFGAVLREQRVDLALEVLEVLEALIDAGEPDVGDVVERSPGWSIAALRHGSILGRPDERSSSLAAVGRARGRVLGIGRRVSLPWRYAAASMRSNRRVPSRLTTTSRAASIRS